MTYDNCLLPQIEAMIDHQPIPKTDADRSKLVALVLPIIDTAGSAQKEYILQKLIERWGLKVPATLT